MRVVYLYQYFGTPKGSWSTRVYEMTMRWVKQGHNVVVITTPYDKSDIRASKFIDRQVVEGIEVIVINLKQSNKHSLIRRVYTFALYSFIACWFVLRLRYDVIIASSGPITVGIPALVATWLRRKPMVFEVRDLWPRGAIELGVLRSRFIIGISYLLEKLCYRSSRLIVACSTGIRDDIKKRFPESEVVVVPNGCDNELFSTPDPAFTLPSYVDGRKIIVYAGSMGVMDDCGQIIEAASVLSQRSYSGALIVMIGEGAERNFLERTSKDMALTNIVFLGLIPKEEVVNWLSVAGAAIVTFKNIPVLDTSSPNKFFDYLAAGVPVIQTTQGWIRDLISEKDLGINVLANEAEGLADAIVKICEHPVRQRQWSTQARRAALELFDRDSLSSHMMDSLTHAVSR